jgi:hypothetical protein
MNNINPYQFASQTASVHEILISQQQRIYELEHELRKLRMRCDALELELSKTASAFDVRSYRKVMDK